MHPGNRVTLSLHMTFPSSWVVSRACASELGRSGFNFQQMNWFNSMILTKLLPSLILSKIKLI